MSRKLDPNVATILKAHGFGPDACWDCHGVWVVYHRVLEQIAAKAGIWFNAPMVLECNGTAKSVALCVTGHLGDTEEWSIGEAAPGNNKNNYPYAMAEKRAKDRVVLKLIGLHGLVYSEDEMEDTNGGGGASPSRGAADKSKSESAAPPTLSAKDSTDLGNKMIGAIRMARESSDLRDWGSDPQTKANIDTLLDPDKQRVRDEYKEHMKALEYAERTAA